MSDEDETVGELIDKVEALGTYAHVDSFGNVWRLKYLGSVDAADWKTATEELS